MNEIVNKFLSARDNFMPEMHLRKLVLFCKPGFTYSACDPFIKNKLRIQKFKETEDSGYIYRNRLDKACFQNDMAFRDFKDLPRRTASDKVLCAKVFNIAKKPRCDRYRKGLTSLVYMFFDKKFAGANTSSSDVKTEIMSSQRHSDLAMLDLAEELHKPIIKKFEKFKVYL